MLHVSLRLLSMLAVLGLSAVLIALNPIGDTPVAFATSCPGPDSFGYGCGEGGSSFTSGTFDIGNHCDDCVTAIPLPFPFNFYGTSYTTANVSSNGNLQFGSADVGFDNTALPTSLNSPTSTFNDALFVHWDDLLTTGEGFGIFTITQGVAPFRRFVIEWRAHYVASVDLANFEIILDETSNRISFIYGSLSGRNGASATVGIQRGNGSVHFFQKSFNSPSLSVTEWHFFGPTADLSITKTGPSTVSGGQVVTYTTTVTNNGPNTSYEVVYDDSIMGDASLVVVQQSGPTFTAGAVGTNFRQLNTPSLAVGAAGTAVFRTMVTVNQSAAEGATITNSAFADSFDTVDVIFANDHVTVSSTVHHVADLAVTMTDSPDPVMAGSNLTYTLTVQNNGPANAHSVVLGDLMPANTTFVSLSQSSGPSFTLSTPPVGGTGAVSATIATLTRGSTAVFQLVVRVNPGAAPGSTIQNAASVSTTTDDQTLTNNAAATTTTVLGANLAVTKTASPDPVLQGQNVTYTVTATNAGPHDAQSIQLVETLPANATLVSQTPAAGFNCTSLGPTSPITCTRPTLGVGASAVFTFTMRLNEGTPADTPLTNTSTVSSTTPDPSLANNTATTTVSAARQNVQVGVAPSGGRLQASVRARNAACTPNNQVSALHFTQTDNATVDVLGQVGRSGDFTVPVSPPTQQVTFFVNRVLPGQAATVRLIVTDGCGTWETLAGGGNNAFPPADAASPTPAPAPQPPASPTPAGPVRSP